MNNQKLIIYLRVIFFCWIIKFGKSQSDWDFGIDYLDYSTLEQEILSLMGFPETLNDQDKPPIKKRSAPKYMEQIYNQSLEHESTEMFNITEMNRIMKEKSDVIVSFMPEQIHTDGDKPDHIRRMWFDTSGVSKDNNFLYAELRLYKTTDGVSKKHRRAHKIVVDRVYRDIFHEKQFDEIDSMIIAADFEGWVVLNVTRLLRHWIENPRENRGIRVVTYPVGREGKKVKTENIGIVGFDGPDEKQPFITGFFKNKYNNKIQIKPKDLLHRRKRSKRSAEVLSVDTFTRRQLNRPVSTYTGECKRQNYHVNFRDIKWHDWVIAPEGYDMYYCDGKCTAPLTTKANATNYAILLSLYHQIHPNKAPEPCCIASKLSPLQLLYFENENRVVYKKFTNMIVSGCGCR